MGDLTTDVEAAVTALAQVQTDVTSEEPSFADKVLTAVQPVFEAEGWTAPAAPAQAPADPNATPTEPENTTDAPSA